MRTSERWIIGAALLVLLGCCVAPTISSVRERIRMKHTMRDMQAIAAALDAHSAPANRYPRARGIEQAARIVHPRSIATRDAWGNPFLFVSGPHEHRIVSTGAGGEVERSVDEWMRSTLNPDGWTMTHTGFRQWLALETLLNEQKALAWNEANRPDRDLAYSSRAGFIRRPQYLSTGETFLAAPGVVRVTRWSAAGALASIAFVAARVARRRRLTAASSL